MCDVNNLPSTVPTKFVDELPEPYRDVFSTRFQSFNKIQSTLIDLIIETDKSLGKCIFFVVIIYTNFK